MTQEITGASKFDFDYVANNDCRVSPVNFYNENTIMPKQRIEMSPLSYEEVKDIVKKVQDGYDVVLRLDDLSLLENSKETMRRIVDFIGGAFYILSYKIYKISPTLFLLSDK